MPIKNTAVLCLHTHTHTDTESCASLSSVEAINSAQKRIGAKNENQRRLLVGCRSLTGVLEARLHAAEEPEPPLPGLQLPLPVGCFPLGGTLAADLGPKLRDPLLRLPHQGGQVRRSALQAHD